MKNKYSKLNKMWLILGSTALLSGTIITCVNLDKNINSPLSNLNVYNITRNDDSNSPTYKVTVDDLSYVQNNNNNPPFTYNTAIDFKDNNNDEFYFSVQIVLNFQTTNIQQLSMQLSFTDSQPTQDWYNSIWKPNVSTINNDFTNKINDALTKQPFVGSYKLSGLNVTINFDSTGETITNVNLGEYSISSQFTNIATQLKDAETKFNTLNNTQIGLIVVIIVLIIIFGVMTFLIVRKKKKMIDVDDEIIDKKNKKT